MYKKFFLALFLIIILLSPHFSNKKAFAQQILGTGAGTVTVVLNTDPGTVAAQTAAKTGWIKNTASWVWNQKDVISKWALKTAGQVLKKALLDRLVDATIAWINRGGEGAVIENWEQLFEDAGQSAVGVFAQSLGAGFLCSPFNIHVQLALIPTERFTKITCTLNGIIGNINNFSEDFRNGNWIAYQETWYPRNNFYGGTIIAIDEAARAEARAKEAAQNQAVAGRGFLSFEKEDCIANQTGPYISSDCKITAPPGYTGGQRYVKEKRVVTPGDFVGATAKKIVIDTPIDSVIGADDTAKYITAIVNAGINKLATLGVEGLRGVFKKRTSDFTTVTPTAPCAGLSGEAFRACLGYRNTEQGVFLNDRYTIQSQINDTLQPRKDAANIFTQLITSQTNLVNSLNDLANCRPTDNNVKSQLAEEQATLDELQNKFDDNQTFLAPLEETSDRINNLNDPDWPALTVQSGSSLQLLDSETADKILTAAQEDQTNINANIDAKLSGVKSQLTSCPK